MLKIRLCTAKDIDVCAEIQTEEYSKEPYNEKWTNKTSFERLNEIFVDNKKYCLVAEDKGKVVGFVFGRMHHWWDGKRVFAEEIIVLKDYQKKGIGRLLWQEFEKRLKKDNVKYVYGMIDHSTFEFHKKNGLVKSNFELVEKFL